MVPSSRDQQRFGALGKYGSIAVIERLMRTIKSECTRRLALVPLQQRQFRNEISLFVRWYNTHRPHEGLGNSHTPEEMYRGLPSVTMAPRFEPRRRWPRGSPCAAPRAPVRGRRGVKLVMNVEYVAGRKHLPVVTLQRAA